MQLTAVVAACVAISGWAQNRAGADGVTTPVLLQKVEPAYSRLALKAKVLDSLMLNVEVGADGKPHNIKIARPSLDPELDRQGIRAVEQWRFQPGTKNGHPVTVFSQIEVHFRILGRTATDYKAAAKAYKPVAANGNADAQYSMGAILYRDKKFAEARKWFEKSAEQGVCQAQHQLGVMVRNGEGGAADEQEAKGWFEKSGASDQICRIPTKQPPAPQSR